MLGFNTVRLHWLLTGLVLRIENQFSGNKSPKTVPDNQGTGVLTGPRHCFVNNDYHCYRHYVDVGKSVDMGASVYSTCFFHIYAHVSSIT
jgi:hypothetical protein